MQNQSDRTGADAPADKDAVNNESTPSVDERLNAALAELDQLRDQGLRERADLENQRRRMQRYVDSARRLAHESLLGDLLPVIYRFTSGVGAEESDAKTLRAIGRTS